MSSPPPPSILPPPRLTIELVPATSWFTNVRSLVPAATWTRLQQATFQVAHHRCEICGGRGQRWPVECHETWQYDEQTRIQTLSGLIALCPACHQVKHFGLARVRGQQEQAGRHLMHVNGWTRPQAHAYVQAAFEQWERRSAGPWTVDVRWLQQAGT